MSSLARGLFVTGTDTGVGKTEVTCGLLRAAQRLDLRAAGMKPIAAGARRVGGRWVNTDVEAIARASKVRIAARLRNPYLFAAPIAPHIAARDDGVEIDLRVIHKAYRQIARKVDAVIVEGVGGFCVPINECVRMDELAARLRLPVVLVVGMRLGCLSHALLTAEAIERRGLRLAGWISNRVDPAMRRYRDNVTALRERLGAPLLGEIPHVAPRALRRAAIDQALDLPSLAHWLAPDFFSRGNSS